MSEFERIYEDGDWITKAKTEGIAVAVETPDVVGGPTNGTHVLTGDASGGDGSGTAGNIEIIAGDGGASGGDGGSVSLQGGDANSPGRVTIKHNDGSTAIGTNTDSLGDAAIYGKADDDGSLGAALVVYSGSPGSGGDTYLQAGSAAGDDGGDVIIRGGNADPGTGQGGGVFIQGGAADVRGVVEIRNSDGDPLLRVGTDGNKVGFFGSSGYTQVQVPASPTAQDVVDVLVALGLVTQAP